MADAIDSPMGFITEWIVQLSTMDHNQVVPIKHVKITVRSGPALNGCRIFIKTGHKITPVAGPVGSFSIRFQMELAQKLPVGLPTKAVRFQNDLGKERAVYKSKPAAEV